MPENTFTIDATGKSFGRVASEAASILIGKNRVDFAKHKAPEVAVTIVNASKLHMTDRKKQGKQYTRYSGYPGGLKTESMAQRIGRKGNTDVLKTAIHGMLPKNKLRAQMMKRLSITN